MSQVIKDDSKSTVVIEPDETDMDFCYSCDEMAKLKGSSLGWDLLCRNCWY